MCAFLLTGRLSTTSCRNYGRLPSAEAGRSWRHTATPESVVRNRAEKSRWLVLLGGLASIRCSMTPLCELQGSPFSAFGSPKRTLDASFGFRRHSTDLRIAGSHSHLARIDGENLQPGDNHRCISVQDTAAS